MRDKDICALQGILAQRKKSWILYKMVSQNRLLTFEGKWAFSENKIWDCCQYNLTGRMTDLTMYHMRNRETYICTIFQIQAVYIHGYWFLTPGPYM